MLTMDPLPSIVQNTLPIDLYGIEKHLLNNFAQKNPEIKYGQY